MREKVRVFVAVHLPSAQREALERSIVSLGEHGLDKVRWVRAEGIHLTLKFLGDIPAPDVEAVTGTMLRAAGESKQFRLELSTLGVFPNLKRARVLWCGVDGQMEALSALQQRIEQGLEGIGYPRENRPFTPHLTLGRVREGDSSPNAAMLQRALDTCAPRRQETWLVDEVCLMRTTPMPGGSRYDVIGTAKLGSCRP